MCEGTGGYVAEIFPLWKFLEQRIEWFAYTYPKRTLFTVNVLTRFAHGNSKSKLNIPARNVSERSALGRQCNRPQGPTEENYQEPPTQLAARKIRTFMHTNAARHQI